MGFDAWAIVELMGHQRIAGKVSEEVVASATLLRVDVPKTSRRDGYTKIYGAGAIYCITPTDEATASAAAESFDQPPIDPWIVRIPTSPALAEKVIVEDDDDDYYDGRYFVEDENQEWPNTSDALGQLLHSETGETDEPEQKNNDSPGGLL